MSDIYRTSEQADEEHSLLHKKQAMNQLSEKCVIMCWNVWSILSETKLQNVLQILKDNDVGIACICETWFDSSKGTFTSTIKRNGYEPFHAHREGKRGGGVAIIYRKQLAVKDGEASTTVYVSFEYSYVLLTLQSKRKLLLLCLYRKQEISFTMLDGDG